MSSNNYFVRGISHLPCVPATEAMPETPNIDQIRDVLARYFPINDSKTDSSIVERQSAADLCSMTQSILKYLPSVEDAPEGQQHRADILSHFDTIKKFYKKYQDMGFDPSPALETLFNSLQIYESVMSISFVLFQEYPAIMNSISDLVNKAIKKIDGYKTKGCCVIICCGVALLSKFNSILAAIDKKLGELGIIRVVEFVANIIEIFCRFFHIDISNTDVITALSNAIENKVKLASSTLRRVFGDAIPAFGRVDKWGPLNITMKIRGSISRFEKQSPIVQRTITSLENFFHAVANVEKNLQHFSLKSSGTSESDPLHSQYIADQHLSALEEIINAGRFFQHLEVILSYGVLLFTNEDDLMNPVIDNIDECTRIINKYLSLHPLYKIICGVNYLSKIKVIIEKIVNLMLNSNLNISSPQQFAMQLQEKYPNMLFLICESIVNDNFRREIDMLPGGIKDVLDKGVQNFRDVDITSPGSVETAMEKAAEAAAARAAEEARKAAEYAAEEARRAAEQAAEEARRAAEQAAEEARRAAENTFNNAVSGFKKFF